MTLITFNLQLEKKKQGNSRVWEDMVYLGDFSTSVCFYWLSVILYLVTALVLLVLRQRKELRWQFYLCVGQAVEVINIQLDPTWKEQRNKHTLYETNLLYTLGTVLWEKNHSRRKKDIVK